MDVALGFLLGVIVTASALAVWRLSSAPRRVLSPGGEAMREALHAATATLPHLRRGLGAETAAKSAPYLRALVDADAVGIADERTMLAADGPAAGWLAPTGAAPEWAVGGRDDRVRVVDPLSEAGAGPGAAVVAPVVVMDERIGTLIAVYADGRRLRPEDTRVVAEAASLVAAQVELSAVEEQQERLARAELRALRAQISPHFIYNALAAVASYIHTRPEEARELLTEFAEFTRYAFRAERPYVTLADELHYVEKYLRLEQARFGDRLQMRVEVAPEVLSAVVPAFSMQPLVENAVRHGVESQPGPRMVEIVGADLGADVELRVSDDGAGIDPARVPELLAGRGGGGIGLANVQSRLQATFGAEYGLRIERPPGGGTTVVMTVPKFRPGVRARAVTDAVGGRA